LESTFALRAPVDNLRVACQPKLTRRLGKRERRLAVREGFEPSVELLRSYNGLANRRLQPLGHLTVMIFLTISAIRRWPIRLCSPLCSSSPDLRLSVHLAGGFADHRLVNDSIPAIASSPSGAPSPSPQTGHTVELEVSDRRPAGRIFHCFEGAGVCPKGKSHRYSCPARRLPHRSRRDEPGSGRPGGRRSWNVLHPSGRDMSQLRECQRRSRAAPLHSMPRDRAHRAQATL
jgi:hypothetical protein